MKNVIILSVHGSWGVWGNWSSCSTTCGGGKRTRIMPCNDPVPDHGGKNCSAESLAKMESIDDLNPPNKIEMLDCNPKPCPGRFV